MDDICRLCCSAKYVNNYIFDDENALYLKMSLYIPFKVFKNDRLPQKICDKCSCKVNDLYQFCSEAIEVQTRLRDILLPPSIPSNDSIDLTLIKENVHSPSESSLPPQNNDSTIKNDRTKPQTPIITYNDQSTQTDNTPEQAPEIKVKEEPKPPTPLEIKIENNESDIDISNNVPSDDSEDESLINIKKRKKETKRSKEENNEIRRRGRKHRLKEWEILVKALPEGTIVVDKSQVPNNDDLKAVPKIEMEVKNEDIIKQVKVKKEVNDLESFHCCICAEQCYTRSEMIQHYRRHATDAKAPQEPPEAPPPPDVTPLRCPRCSRVLDRGSWGGHWRRHWERDHRPYRCALCEKTFREPYQILKHGVTHKLGEEGTNSTQPAEKRFVCDLCPEVFVYMRYLLAHRTRVHPEASSRALTLRCAQCAREFAHLNSLRRHLRAHSGERNFLCNVCGKALSSREHLKFHIRIHTGYKPNVCKTCGKGFVKKCNLTLHERVHSGEKPHVCSHCGKAFSQRSTLVIHERYHSGARPYVCGLCGRGFVAKGLLSMHLKTTCI